jgi:hypothetical protein
VVVQVVATAVEEEVVRIQGLLVRLILVVAEEEQPLMMELQVVQVSS